MSTNEAQAALTQGGRRQQSGNVVGAAQSYRRAIADSPEIPEAWLLLGSIGLQRDDVAGAVRWLRRCATIAPRSADARLHLGRALLIADRTREAVGELRHAVRLRPMDAEAHNSLGAALERAGNASDALASFGAAVAIDRRHWLAQRNLAALLLRRGEFDRAASEYRRLVEAGVADAEVHHRLGLAETAKGTGDAAVGHHVAAVRLDPSHVGYRLALAIAKAGLRRPDARAEFRRCLALDPASVEVLRHLAEGGDAATNFVFRSRGLAVVPRDVRLLALRGASHIAAGRAVLGRRDLHAGLALEPSQPSVYGDMAADALERGHGEWAQRWHRRAVALAPDRPDLRWSLAGTLQALKRMPESARSYRQSLALDPGAFQALGNFGTLYQESGWLDRAAELYGRALAAHPTSAILWNNLGNALTDIDKVVAAYRRAVDLDPNYAAAHSNLLFALNYRPGVGCEELFEEYRRWEERHARPAYARIEPFANEPDPERVLRVGFLSADFKANPIAGNFIGLLERRDPEVYRAYCYGEVLQADSVTERYRKAVDAFRLTVGLSDPEAADMIRRDRIDILVSLAGHTAYNRIGIAARKPAPIQMSYGDLTTTGLSVMDYWLTDRWIHPEETQERFTERLWRLPLLVIHDPPPDAPAVGPLPALAAGHITFGSCNNVAKLNEPVFALWAEVLNAVPNSRLLLKYVNWFANPSVRDRVRRSFERHGIGAERIEFAGERLPRGQHLNVLNRIDIALDPFPFNGCTTTFEALWMGVPVVTLAGERFLGRMGIATLMPVGLGELVGSDRSAYVEIAAALATDLPRLARLRRELRRRVAQSPLCDAAAYARSVETAFRTAWRWWCRTPSSRNGIPA
jgi:predicted O-linked N-acetylglucosamine transferase (SPINDLY family)